MEKSRSIIEDQAQEIDDHEVRGSNQPYFSINLGNRERYDLIYLPLQDGLQAVAHYSEEQGETIGFHEIEELLEGDSSEP